MKIKKSDKLVYLFIVSTIFFFGGTFLNFNWVINSILIVLGFGSIFGIVIFSKGKDIVVDKNVEEPEIELQKQQQIIDENIDKIINLRQEKWKHPSQNIDKHHIEQVTQLRKLKENYKSNEYFDLTKNSDSIFEKQLLKKGVDSQGYLDLSLPENQTKETIKHKIDELLHKKTKIKNLQMKYYGSGVKNTNQNKIEEILKNEKEHTNLSRGKKDDKTLSNLSSGDTKHTDKSLHIERSGSVIADNHLDLDLIKEIEQNESIRSTEVKEKVKVDDISMVNNEENKDLFEENEK